MIHHTAIISKNVTFGDNVQVGPYCVIGSPHGALHIPDGSVIRSHSVIEGGNTFGPGLETGHHVLIRTGNVFGRSFKVGSYASIEGGVTAGDGVRLGGRVQMGSQFPNGERLFLGDNVVMYGNVFVTDVRKPPSSSYEPPWFGRGCVICANAVILAGVRVGDGAFVAAQAFVDKDVPDGGFFGRREKAEWPEADDPVWARS